MFVLEEGIGKQGRLALMNILKLLCCRLPSPLFAVLILLGTGLVWAEPQDQAAQVPAQGQQDQSQKQSDKPALSGAEGSVQPTQANPAPASPTQAPQEKEVKITPREAEELFHSVDEILAFDHCFAGVVDLVVLNIFRCGVFLDLTQILFALLHPLVEANRLIL